MGPTQARQKTAPAVRRTSVLLLMLPSVISATLLLPLLFLLPSLQLPSLQLPSLLTLMLHVSAVPTVAASAKGRLKVFEFKPDLWMH